MEFCAILQFVHRVAMVYVQLQSNVHALKAGLAQAAQIRYVSLAASSTPHASQDRVYATLDTGVPTVPSSIATILHAVQISNVWDLTPAVAWMDGTMRTAPNVLEPMDANSVHVHYQTSAIVCLAGVGLCVTHQSVTPYVDQTGHVQILIFAHATKVTLVHYATWISRVTTMISSPIAH
jgi:hypothetical protein